ncbi:O-methyltransferase [Oscillatoria sp. FACHB-1407]|uniref:O-methyltransferase n=1 Tax=Oscillatoria sp. FACHB-1407 TaxID=2692847 RepID=UPI001F54E02D|nr:class I SAM-dependent methyltransferase [Oscillatoria sp. FACHB-1407]
MTFSVTNSMPATPPRPITPVKIAAHHLEKAIALLPQITDTPGDLAIHLQKALLLIAGLDDYLERSTTPESLALTEIAQKTQHEPWQAKFDGGETEQHLEQEMLTGHLEGQALKMFVRMTGAKRVLDIGMFTGYSALAMAEALPEDGCLVACEIDPYAAQFAQRLFERSPHGHKIGIKLGAASDTLDQLIADQATFDFAFIDANKAGYVEYYEKLIGSNLLAPNGYICADNTLFLGEVYLSESEQSDTAKAIAHFNQVVADDPRTEQVLLPVRDGLTLIRRI